MAQVKNRMTEILSRHTEIMNDLRNPNSMFNVELWDERDKLEQEFIVLTGQTIYDHRADFAQEMEWAMN